MKVIYQIGRFDSGAFSEINFKINEKIYSASLSSFALREYFKDAQSEAKAILLYPVSLILNKQAVAKLNSQYDEFKTIVEEILKDSAKKEDFLKNPKKYFAKHPHSLIADDFCVIHSLGEYEGIQFETTLEELILEIFSDMVFRYLDKPFNQLYLDISSGLNIYVSALIEAGRLFLTFYKLQNFLPEPDPLKVYIVFSDPIIPPYNRFFEIHKDFSLEVKTFFSFPERPKETNLENAFSSFAKNLTEDDRSLKRFLNKLFSNAYLFYSAIKNNTPLVLYTFEYDDEKEIEKGIRDLLSKIQAKLFENYQNTPKLDFDKFRKAILMLSIYKGIVRVLKNERITVKAEVSLSELYQKFRDEKLTIYKYFDLMPNRTYLGHEISNNFEKKEMIESLTSEYRPFKEYLLGEGNEIHSRNFLAHCGFERNCLEIKKEGEEIWLRYKDSPEIKKRIIEILLGA